MSNASAAARIAAIFPRMILMDSGKSTSGAYGPSDSTLSVNEARQQAITY